MAVQQRATERAVVAGLTDENITCVSLTATGTIRAGAASSIGFTGRSILTSSADAVLAARNAADNADSAFSCAALTASGNITVPAGGSFLFSGRGGFTCSADGVVTLANNAGTALTRLILGAGADAVNGVALRPETGGQKLEVRTSGGTTFAGILALQVETTGRLQSYTGTAIPAGGTAGVGLRMSSTSNFGVFFGSGAPSLAAAKGSLYLRSDGSGVADRAYINTDGSTTWSAITTVG